ncbi:exodeoxyribonuclease VII large subunit [Lichenicola cladoniae]|uniref:Exodeoxyribonuclease 7 large subunit n=1 Tax=Lichenicola cladoniae TaxID=1484109 RepID=A0A6M8HTC9_9PROT|nr:exodeoxyribonuclease VII large subunit [Lichenicola cladoniae]NPD65320.1 exodeoxyribonuclease VII large subunit [Acetobacteraceae bacterium]QKE91590.1 exodeoxyribonuclease VII large subunit [Lichenicola cladoniae]
MDEAASPNSGNLTEYSVSEISGAVKRVLEGSFSRVRVRGEITEFKRYPSGHLYFSLKDEGGKIAGVVWRNSVARLGLVPENGLEVVVTGRISSYGERSSYQLIIERMEYAGEGALLARIERLRQTLAAEGLFDAALKQKLPFLPSLIGLVTSAQGAVLHDIRTTIARRFPRSLLLWPVPVQGEGAALRIAAAIFGFDRRTGTGTGIPRPDLLIVARGGGSLEDLMAFSDEAVLRAVAACRIPVISAVGHETDTTLIDFVSDCRAPTPTAAAELAVPARAELVADLAHRAARLESGIVHLNRGLRLRLDRAAGLLPDLPTLLGHVRQRLDDRLHRLDLALPNLLHARRAALAAGGVLPDLPGHLATRRRDVRELGHRLALALPALTAARRTALVAAERHMPSPHGLIGIHRGRVAVAANGLQSGLRQTLRDSGATLRRHQVSPAPLAGMLRERRAVLDGLSARLASISPMTVLSRGYVLVRDQDGHAMTEAASLRAGMRLSLTFADGERQVRVERDPTSQGALAL